MRRFPTGVAVVTVDVDGERLGLTVGSVLSLSLEPPLVGISVSRHAALHELLREAGAFGVSLLAADQAELAAHFSRGVPPIALWSGIATRPARAIDAPLLEGALGWIECRAGDDLQIGDHTLFVGEVLEVEPGRAARPLVHLDQRYVSL
jgi:flavin reductase (DIM6/NTAB) family NADH-FMN oxidoreductase RutF